MVLHMAINFTHLSAKSHISGKGATFPSIEKTPSVTISRDRQLSESFSFSSKSNMYIQIYIKDIYIYKYIYIY